MQGFWPVKAGQGLPEALCAGVLEGAHKRTLWSSTEGATKILIRKESFGGRKKYSHSLWS